MVLVAALLLAAAPGQPAQSAQPAQPPRLVTAEQQAMATVRILSGDPIRFSELEKQAPERFRDAHIRGVGGAPEPARLIEFH